MSQEYEHRRDCRCPCCDPEMGALMAMSPEQLAVELTRRQGDLARTLTAGGAGKRVMRTTQPQGDTMDLDDRVKLLKETPLYAGWTEDEIRGALRAALKSQKPWTRALTAGSAEKATTTPAGTIPRPWTAALEAEKEAA